MVRHEKVIFALGLGLTAVLAGTLTTAFLFGDLGGDDWAESGQYRGLSYRVFRHQDDQWQAVVYLPDLAGWAQIDDLEDTRGDAVTSVKLFIDVWHEANA